MDGKTYIICLLEEEGNIRLLKVPGFSKLMCYFEKESNRKVLFGMFLRKILDLSV